MGTPRVDSLKFVNYTIIENAHEVRKKIFVFYVAVICATTGGRTDTGFCVPLWSIRLNCQLMTKLETNHILQAQVCNDISTKNETGNQWYIIKPAKLNQARWNRKVLRFDSEKQLKVHNYLQGWCNCAQPKKPPGYFLKSPLNTNQ